jgi:hypothetical protein
VEIDWAAATSLLNADAVRSRAHQMLGLGLSGRLPHFLVDLRHLDNAVDFVLTITCKAYPTLDVPFHSRWRHFVSGNVDRWAAISDAKKWSDRRARARAEFDLAIISVFLDAGAGSVWRYRHPITGMSTGRSEGLAQASLDMFARGAFSARGDEPLRVDGKVLSRMATAELREGFQVTGDNPLVGIDGRAELLRRLGTLVSDNPDIFAREDPPRPGGLFDHLLATSENGTIAATTILSELLRRLGPIWPSRIELRGIPLGDCWRHPSIETGDCTNGLVPLHKLSQWLTYSLIEPLQRAGLSVTNLDGLTGLAEYRNGGLFVDAGVLQLRDPADQEREHEVGSTLVVEWRALTVALLDRLAVSLRARLGLDAASLPLASILQGGTWTAGRVLALERRADGSPPIKVMSDGTVF